MRAWRAVSVVAMVLGVGAVLGPAEAVEPDESSPAPLESVPEHGSRTGYAEVASVMYAEPVLAVESLRIETIVFVETGSGRHLKFVSCPLFTVERDATETTITAYCEARKTALGKQAHIDIRAYNQNANTGEACETADRELRRNIVFSCTVTDPSMSESAA
jgi:hypothetical protein